MDSETVVSNKMEPSSPDLDVQDPSPGPADVESFPLYKQSSIYSLTLDEFQHAVCEPGKNFGSMNMDEFLTNIWTAEENQALSVAISASSYSNRNPNPNPNPNPDQNARSTTNLSRHSSLHRQGSLTLPAPLCRKTVEEVWSEIHKQEQRAAPASDEQQGHERGTQGNSGGGSTNVPPRQPTFGEMTLEDFLIKAGVVREGCPPPSFPTQGAAIVNPQAQQFGSSYGMAGYQMSGHIQGSNLGGGGKRNSGSYGGEVPYNTGRIGSTTTGMVGFGGLHMEMGRGSPTAAPMATSVGGVGHEQYKSDVEGMASNGWRKQGLDSPVEKVVERRQRRMIKNRESAARSRARKQAYTVELEAELDQLRKENARLRKEREEAEQRRKRKLLEAINGRIQVATKQKSSKLRRTLTGPW